MSELWPLLDEFPRLAEIPRVVLRTAPTPVEQIDERLWIKRDDLNAIPIGGNKVRALEFLLAQFPRGSHVMTGGSRGSTHVLSTVLHAKRLGIEIDAASWPQEMNDVARAVDARIDQETERRHFRHPVTAAAWLTWQTWCGNPVIPAGGSSPLGTLGHVNAGLELAEQVRGGDMPCPRFVVVPLGTGGTAGGLALGFAIAGLPTEVLAARVVPRIVSTFPRVVNNVRRTHGLLQKLTRDPINSDGMELRIVKDVYGGAYGRPLARAPRTTANGVPLDPTYSAKAYVAATDAARDGDTLFWHTFDSRWMNQ